MNENRLTKAEMARRMGTSRSQINRLLDPESDSVTLETLARAAQAVGRDFFALPLGPVIELMRNAIRTSDGELRVPGTVDVEFPLPSSGKKARMRLVRLGDDDDPVGVVGIVSSAWN